MASPDLDDKTKLENQAELQKRKGDLKLRFVRDFIQEQRRHLSGPNNVKFLDELAKASKKSGAQIPNQYKADIERFYKLKKDSYIGFSPDDIKLSDLLVETMPFVKSLENKRNLLKKKAESVYQFALPGATPPGDYDTVVAPIVETTLDESDIIRAIHSPTRLTALINRAFPTPAGAPAGTVGTPPLRKDEFKNIATTFGLDSSKINSLPHEYQQQAIALLHQISAGSSSIELDLEELFNIPGLLTPAQKKKILGDYLPIITLSKSLELGIIKHSDGLRMKKDFIKTNYFLHDLEGSTPVVPPIRLTPGQIDSIASLLRDDDVWLEVDGLTLSSTEMDNLIKNYGFKKMAEDFRKPVESLMQIEDEAEAFAKFLDIKKKLKDREELTEKNFASENKTIIGASKFETGATLVMKGKTAEGKKTQFYLKVVDDGSRNKGLVVLADVGVSSYDKAGNNIMKIKKGDTSLGVEDIQTMDYTQLEKLMDGTAGGAFQNMQIEVLNSTEVTARKNSGEIEEYSHNLSFKTEREVEDEINRQSSTLEPEKKRLTKEQEDQKIVVHKLHEKLEKAKKRLEKKGVSHKDIDDDADIKDIKSELAREEEKLQRISKEYDTVTSTYDSAMLGPNFHHLIAKINDEDPSGVKYGLERGTTFVTKPKKSGDKTAQDYWTITDCKHDRITIMHQNASNKVTLTLEAFYEGFVGLACKRVQPYKKSQDFLSSFLATDKIKSGWEGIEIKDGKFVKSETVAQVEDSHGHHAEAEHAAGHSHAKKKEKQTKEFTFDFLVSTNNEELLKVYKIDEASGTVLVSFGEVETKEVKSKKKDGDKTKKETWAVENQKVSMSFAYFEKYVRDNKLVPRSLDKDNEERERLQKEQNTERKNSFWTRFLQNYSFADVADGLKQGWETIEHYMHQGQHEKATMFLGQYIAPLIPHNEIKNHILSDQEGAQKKRMDEMIEKLEKNMDSWWSTTEILHWLLNKDTPQYKIEAGVMFMIKNYGVLYGKKGQKGTHYASGLQAYRGKFLWYEALGGRVGDALYMQVKNDMENAEQPIPFTEEELVYILLVRQGKKEQKPHRRSRLHKEYKALRNQAKDEEKAKGIKDGKGERQQKKQLSKAFDEMEAGNYPNMWGWYEEAMKRGGPLENQTGIPFVMFFSGIIYKFESHVIASMKNYPAEGMMVPLLRFVSRIDDMDLVNRVILQVCKRLHDINPTKYPDIYNDAKEIFDAQRVDGKDKEREKQKRCMDFYNKYSRELSDALNMVNGKGTMASKLIYMEKDGYKLDEGGRKSKENEDFKNYYEKMQGYANAEFTFDKKGTLNDGVADGGTTGVALYKATLQTLRPGTTALFSTDAEVYGPAWKEIQDEFESIPLTVFTGSDPSSADNRRLQKLALKARLREFMAGILVNYNEERTFKKLEGNGLTAFLPRSGAKPSDYFHAGLSPEDLLHGGKGDAILEKHASSIIRFVESGGKSSASGDSALQETIAHVKQKATVPPVNP